MTPTKHPNILLRPESGTYFYRGSIGGVLLDKVCLGACTYKKAVFKARHLEALYNVEALRESLNLLISVVQASIAANTKQDKGLQQEDISSSSSSSSSCSISPQSRSVSAT